MKHFTCFVALPVTLTLFTTSETCSVRQRTCQRAAKPCSSLNRSDESSLSSVQFAGCLRVCGKGSFENGQLLHPSACVRFSAISSLCPKAFCAIPATWRTRTLSTLNSELQGKPTAYQIVMFPLLSCIVLDEQFSFGDFGVHGYSWKHLEQRHIRKCADFLKIHDMGVLRFAPIPVPFRHAPCRGGMAEWQNGTGMSARSARIVTILTINIANKERCFL